MVCRPLLSLLHATFKFIQDLEHGGRAWVWPSVQEEIRRVHALLPIV